MTRTQCIAEQMEFQETIRENLKDEDALVESARSSYEDARLQTVGV